MTRAIAELLHDLAPLHEAPDDPAAWHGALHSLARAVPCVLGTLVERFGPAMNAGFGLTLGTDPRFADAYAREFHRCDPFAGEHTARLLNRLGRTLAVHQLLPGRNLGTTEFYARFLHRFGEPEHGLIGGFAVDGGSHAQIWLLRARGRDFDESERRCVDMFLAHARAAMRLRRRMTRLERERASAFALLDASCDAICVLDENARVLIANDPAKQTLRAADLFDLRGDILRAARHCETDWIGRAVRETLALSHQSGRLQTQMVNVPDFDGPTGVYAAFVPLTLAPEARIALLLRDLRSAPPRLDALQLQTLFGFTRAETRVANALLGGRTSEDISLAWEVRQDTIRAHVKRMLAKTATRNQGELQKLLLRLLPNVRALCRSDAELDL